MTTKREPDLGYVALVITTIVLYSTGHWIGGTVSLVLLIILAG